MRPSSLILLNTSWSVLIPLPFIRFEFTSCTMQPATSLGGVESLIEQRFQVDPSVDPKMLRISVGVENIEVR